MQQYLGITAAELLATVPPTRTPIEFDQASVPEDASWEEAAEEARAEAAWQSLVLAQAEDASASRVVLSGRLQPHQKHFSTWDEVDEIYVDDEMGRQLCTAIFAAETQQDADRLVEELFEEPLMWFDVSEREELGNALVRAESVDEVGQDQV